MPWALRQTLRASGFAAIPYIYLVWRLVYSFNQILPEYSRTIKTGLIVLAVFLNLLPIVVLFYSWTGNSPAYLFAANNTGWFDYILVFPFWLGLITVVEMLPYFIGLDLIQLTVKLIRLDNYESWVRGLAYIRCGLAVLIGLYIGIKTYTDTYKVENSQYAVELPGNGNPTTLTLSLVADLQIDRYTQEQKISEFLEKVDEADPDILFFAGDIVTRGTDFIDQAVNALCLAKAGLKRIACVGDHDIWSDPRRIARGLKNCGWEFLDDEHYVFTHGDKRILVTGITQVYSRRISHARLTDLMASAPQADVKILLVHQPGQRILKAASDAGYDIFLAGHTHGGQVRFKPLGITITPTQFENRIYSGFEIFNDMNVFVTNGIGLTMMPLRFRASAEITTIELTF